ncbi:hypothetical protein Pmar_PMAR023983, partial [Perkinsus marinus ATCC 50983]
IYGEVRCVGLSADLHWEPTSGWARLYCYVHMWRQAMKVISPMISRKVEDQAA